MTRIRHLLTCITAVLVFAAGTFAAPPAEAAQRLNPFRPLDGIYYSSEASGTALNWAHITSNLFFGVINEYDFEGSGASRWYTFTVSLDYNEASQFAMKVGDYVAPCNEVCGSIAEVARPYEHPSNPAETAIIATGTAELAESTRPPGEPGETHLTGVEVTVTFYSTSVVDVTYGGKTSRFRMLPAVDGFGSEDGLTQSAYNMYGSRSWEANPNYGSYIPGTVPPLKDTDPGDEREGFLDHMQAKWREVPDGLGWTKNDDRGAKFLLFDGYKMPPEVPVAEKEEGQDLFYFKEHVSPGATDGGYNNNIGTLAACRT